MNVKEKWEETKRKVKTWKDEYEAEIRLGLTAVSCAVAGIVIGATLNHKDEGLPESMEVALDLGLNIASRCKPGDIVAVLSDPETDRFRACVLKEDIPELVESGFVKNNGELDCYLEQREEE